jgi:hypothetical protein
LPNIPSQIQIDPQSFTLQNEQNHPLYSNDEQNRLFHSHNDQNCPFYDTNQNFLSHNNQQRPFYNTNQQQAFPFISTYNNLPTGHPVYRTHNNNVNAPLE